MFMQLQEH